VCCGLAIAASLATSACAAGQRAQTADQKPTLDGTEASIGQLDLRDVAVVAPTKGTFYAPGTGAELTMVIVNVGHSTDHLTSITSSAITGWGSYSAPAAAQLALAPPAAAAPSSSASSAPSTSPAAGSSSPSGASSSASSAAAPAPVAAAPAPSRNIAIPPGASTAWGTPDSQLRLVLSGLTRRVYAGNELRLTFTFAHAGHVTVPVPIALTANPAYSYVPEPKGADAKATS
jgi:copper(I)-binding protein